jgi:hypothetical protein
MTLYHGTSVAALAFYDASREDHYIKVGARTAYSDVCACSVEHGQVAMGTDKYCHPCGRSCTMHGTRFAAPTAFVARSVLEYEACDK